MTDLEALRQLYGDLPADKISSDDLAAALSDHTGEPITKAMLGRMLSQHGVSAKPIRIGSRVRKGYTRDDLKKVTPQKVTAVRPASDYKPAMDEHGPLEVCPVCELGGFYQSPGSSGWKCRKCQPPAYIGEGYVLMTLCTGRR